MPLIHSSSDKAFKSNVGTLMDERGKSPHVKNANQALAIAYALKRRGRAAGGLAPPPTPWQVRQEAHGMHTGPILSAVAGRTDRHNMNVPSGAYVMPADHVAALGQGNTLAGMGVLNKMFSSGPYGTGNIPMHAGPGAPRAPRLSDSGGPRGASHEVGKPVPVVTAGGEYVVSPQAIIRKFGSLDVGHKVLDKWVLERRAKHIKTLKGLPPPAKS